MGLLKNLEHSQSPTLFFRFFIHSISLHLLNAWMCSQSKQDSFQVNISFLERRTKIGERKKKKFFLILSKNILFSKQARSRLKVSLNSYDSKTTHPQLLLFCTNNCFSFSWSKLSFSLYEQKVQNLLHSLSFNLFLHESM